jgi:hypothetical protein
MMGSTDTVVIANCLEKKTLKNDELIIAEFAKPEGFI